VILGRVDRNTVQPCIKRAVATKTGQRSISLYKSFLGNIQCLVLIVYITPDQSDDLVLLLFDQQVESTFVTSLNPLDQQLVSGCLTLVRHSVSLSHCDCFSCRCEEIMIQ